MKKTSTRAKVLSSARVQDPAHDIGARLREARESRGLSQRELARRTGVTNGMISLIEQNKVSPSIASFKRVVEGLPMSLGEFFAADLPPREQIFFRANELTALAE